MKRRGSLHLAGGLLIAILGLVASPAAAAQPTIVRLPAGEGVQDCGGAAASASTVAAADAASPDYIFCRGAVGGFAIQGFGSPGEVQTFTVTQTVAGVLSFSNYRDGLYTETIDVTVIILADGSGVSDPFYVKGESLGFSVFSACSPSRCAINQFGILVANVAAMEFQAINSPLDTNPNAAGGLRIFPDKTSAGDTVDRRQVLVTATLSSPQPNVTVYFKAFDMDDPSSDVGPVDSNGVVGRDNRGLQNLDGVVSVQTDANGVARVILTVTMQPGDNYRIAAACMPDYLNSLLVMGTDLVNAAGSTLPTDDANTTPLLTVWRRVHIEVDSMGAVAGNRITGTITRAQYKKRDNQTVFTLSATLPDDATRFLGVPIAIAGVGSLPIVAYTRQTVTVAGAVGGSPTGKAFTLVDDDDFNLDDGANPDGDQGEDPPAPDLSLIQNSDDPASNVFAPAYVRPVYDLPGEGAVSFVLNEPGYGSMLLPTYNFNAIGSEADSNFWTIYLIGAYQPAIAEDGDGENNVFLGIVDSRLGDGQGANVFFESLKEVGTGPFISNAATTAHEVGHLFTGDHTDLGLMSQSGSRISLSFSDVTLDRIRSLVHP